MNLSAKLKSYSVREIVYILYNGDNVFGHLVYNPTEEAQEYFQSINWDIIKQAHWVKNMYTDFMLEVQFIGSEILENANLVVNNLNELTYLGIYDGKFIREIGWYFTISLNNPNQFRNELVLNKLISVMLQEGNNRIVKIDFK